jgi:serine/threonine-protein kinase
MDVTIVVAAAPPAVGPTKTATVAPAATPTPVAPTQVAALPPAVVPSPSQPPRAATASQAVVTLEGAKVETDGAWNLPPFKLDGDARGLELHAEPRPPEGLAFVDLGAGAARIEGRPKQAGAFEFDVVASNGDAPTGRMTVKITVAARQVAVAAPQSTTLLERQNSFLHQYNGGSCFLIRPVSDSANPGLLRGVGAEASEFSRFEAAYRREMGIEPTVRAQTIDGAECPALELLRASADSAVPAPRIELADVEVGSGKPLAGSVTGLAGRHLTLVAVTNDGSAHLIRDNVAADGASAQFSVKFTNDAEDVGHTLALLAIVSDKPLSALNEPRLGKADGLVPKLMDEWAQMGAAADAQFARLTK